MRELRECPIRFLGHKYASKKPFCMNSVAWTLYYKYPGCYVVGCNGVEFQTAYPSYGWEIG